MQLHLLDGTYELFRAFYGAPSAQIDGQEVGATRAWLGNLARLLESGQVSHLAAAFDRPIESFRNELFDGYKTGEGIDPALWSQFELAEQVVQALGCVVWQMVEFEADDALATAAQRFALEPQVERVVLCSPDKDLAQCVSTRIVCWDRLRDLWFDEAKVREKFGVSPRSIPDYLALVGDSADGIPGIAGWGAKSTARVLAQFEHLEHISSNIAEWHDPPRGAARLSASLEAEREAAYLYRRLATLRTDVPLKEELQDLKWQEPNWELLTDLSERIGSDRVLLRLQKRFSKA